MRLGEHATTGGAFADIWLCTCHHPFGSKEVGPAQTFTDRHPFIAFVQVAVKALRLFAPEPIGAHRQVSLEIRPELEIWRRLDHPNVLPFLGITTGFSPFIALVSQWMPNGNLHQFLLQNNATMTTEFRLQLVRALNSGRSLSDLTNNVAFSS